MADAVWRQARFQVQGVQGVWGGRGMTGSMVIATSLWGYIAVTYLGYNPVNVLIGSIIAGIGIMLDERRELRKVKTNP